MTALLNLARWVAVAAAVWNGLWLAAVGLWSIPRTNSNDSKIGRILLLAACFLPLLGAVFSVLKPRLGGMIVLASVAVYLLFCASRAVEMKLAGQPLGWDPQPLYMFAVPSTVIAVIILATAKHKKLPA